MKLVLKSLSVLLIAVFALSTVFLGNSKSFAAEKDNSSEQLTKSQLEEVNTKLDKLKDEANENLEKNNENFTVSEDLSFSDSPISISVDSHPKANDQVNSLAVTPLATHSKSYSVKVKNTAGFNFSHELYGNFVYTSGGKLNSWSHHTTQTGAMYYKTHSYHADRLDSSVAQLTDDGTFKALKYFTEYQTHLVVGLYGSGNYRILKASIN